MQYAEQGGAMFNIQKWCWVFIAVWPPMGAYGATMYHCENANGEKSFQDRPCEEKTIKTEKPKSVDNEQFKKAVARVMARRTGKSEADLNDPKIRQAAEVFAITDAGKAYAYTKVYGISAEYCGPKVKDALQEFQSTAHDSITLGKYYYTVGIDVQLGSKRYQHSGEELTSGLQQLLTKTRNEHESANRINLRSKCQKAEKALKSLSKLYGS